TAGAAAGAHARVRGGDAGVRVRADRRRSRRRRTPRGQGGRARRRGVPAALSPPAPPHAALAACPARRAPPPPPPPPPGPLAPLQLAGEPHDVRVVPLVLGYAPRRVDGWSPSTTLVSIGTGTTASGTVKLANNTALAGAHVSLDLDGVPSTDAVTAADGSFSL